jgi:hypothetical protein
MPETTEFAPATRTWREIPQQVKARAMSPEGRKRLVLAGAKTTGVMALLLAAVWGGCEIISTWRTEPKRIATAADMAPVQEKDLRLVTDGVLDKTWLVAQLALPRNATLLELDLRNLQARLASSGQVKTAMVAKNFPSGLVVTLSERSPVARLRAETGHDFLVARDGVVYAGTGYDPALMEALPWLDGVKLVRVGDGFAPIARMDVVADLLVKGRNEAPQLYQTWRVIDLSRLDSDAEIEVRSSEIPRIIFSTDLDFFTQLSRLDYARDQPGPALKMINVGLGPQVVVTYDETAAPRSRPLPELLFKHATPALPAFPNLQRSPSSKRDL